MAKNNSPLNYSGSWAHHDAEEAKEKYAEGDDAWAHALGRDEFAADRGKWSGTSEHTGNSRWAKGAPTMWESHSQIGKHMSSNLWGEAKREEKYIPELDHGAAMPMKSPLNNDEPGYKDGKKIQTKLGRKQRKEQTTREQIADPDTNIKDWRRKRIKLAKTQGQIKDIEDAAMPMKSSPIHQEDVPKRKHPRIDVDGDGIYDDAEAGEMYFDRSQVYDESGQHALGKSPDMKNLALNSPERLAEYKKRGWALDKTVNQPIIDEEGKIPARDIN
jgi:hypothetical protein